MLPLAPALWDLPKLFNVNLLRLLILLSVLLVKLFIMDTFLWWEVLPHFANDDRQLAVLGYLWMLQPYVIDDIASVG